MDSVASFTYFQEEDDFSEWSKDHAIVDMEEGDPELGRQHSGGVEGDSESRIVSAQRRKSSTFSENAAKKPLLHRYDSSKTNESGFGREARSSQKIYIGSEDLTFVVAGFTTGPLGLILYLTLCTLSLGLGYLILRWLPRWRVRLVGSSKPLRECDWVAIEVRQQP